MSVGAVFIPAPNWRHGSPKPSVHSPGQEINKMWYKHTMGHCSAIKNQTLIHATWMNLRTTKGEATCESTCWWFPLCERSPPEAKLIAGDENQPRWCSEEEGAAEGREGTVCGNDNTWQGFPSLGIKNCQSSEWLKIYLRFVHLP